MSKLYFTFLVGDISKVGMILLMSTICLLMIYVVLIYMSSIMNNINPFENNILTNERKKWVKRMLLMIGILTGIVLFVPSKREMMALYSVKYLENYKECLKEYDSEETQEYIEVINYLTGDHPKEEW